jgi:diguanylate cyclase (GGDEF)-like protein/PAS domain S-box-containing protein
MMMPDIKTLMLLYIIINVISAGAVAVIWGQNRGRFAGIFFWLVDMILQAAGAVLIVLRGLAPDLVSMVLANTMVQAGALIVFIGLERFSGKKGWQIHNYVLLAIFIAIISYYSLVQPDLTAREIALSAMTMILTFQCCWLLLRRVDPGMRQVTRLTGIVFACYAAFSLVRIVLHIIFPRQNNDFFTAGAVDALALTVYIVLSVCLTISLVLMVNRRLLAEVKAQEEKYTTAFRSSPYAITLTRPSDGAIFEVNEGFVNIAGYSYAEIIGKTTLDLHLWVNEEDRLAVVKELAQGRDVHAVEYQFRDKTGEVLTGLFSASLVTINNEICILSSIGDITERKQAEEALARSEEKYRTILDNMQDSYIEVDLAGNFTFVNEAACRNLGYTLEELIWQSFSIIAPGQDEIKAIFNAYSEVYKTGEPHTGFAFKAMRKDGATGYAEISISLIKNEQGSPIGFRSVGRDVTERKQLEQELLEMATHDALTGLPNRTLFYDRCGIALANAQRNKKMLVIMTLDLDLFKDVNDTLGHDMGDKVLIAVAGRLTGALRKSDTVARMGGDEFVLLLCEVDDKDAVVIVAEKILEDFRKPFISDGHSLIITVSIGIATYPEGGANMEDLLRNSDKSMYIAKQNGGDRFII